MLKHYIGEMAQVTLQGDAREESYYSALERLLGEELANLYLLKHPSLN